MTSAWLSSSGDTECASDGDSDSDVELLGCKEKDGTEEVLMEADMIGASSEMPRSNHAAKCSEGLEDIAVRCAIGLASKRPTK